MRFVNLWTLCPPIAAVKRDTKQDSENQYADQRQASLDFLLFPIVPHWLLTIAWWQFLNAHSGQFIPADYGLQAGQRLAF